MKKRFSLSLTFFLLSGFIFVNFSSAVNLATKLKGKILLQVESNGEAWYINPADEKRYSLGRPDDAFNLMREIGIGITNNDLNKIQIADENLSGEDSDNDGLSDMIEDSLGTDKNKADTDGDGYNDKDEILSGYNPSGNGKNINNDFAQKQIGKILLQVESNGEAWYVNPENYKRYFLGRPGDAFNIMRKLGLGISDQDLSMIDSVEQEVEDVYDFEILFNFSKDSYKIHEEIDGEIIVNNNNNEFRDGYILIEVSREGFDKKLKQDFIYTKNLIFDDSELTGEVIKEIQEKYSMTIDEYKAKIEKSFDTSNLYPIKMRAFTYSANGGTITSVGYDKYFSEDGVYGYEVSVYTCSDIENNLNIICQDAKYDEVKKISPTIIAKKEITISGIDSSACQIDSDCIQTCENCKSGTYLCGIAHNIASYDCAECWSNNHQCNEGYKCKFKKCVLR